MAERSVTPPALVAMGINSMAKDLLDNNDRPGTKLETGAFNLRSVIHGERQDVHEDGSVITSTVISSSLSYECGLYEEESIFFSGTDITENRLQGELRENGDISHRSRKHSRGEDSTQQYLYLVVNKFEKDVFSYKEDYKFDLTKIRYLERGDSRGDCCIFTKLGVIFASVESEEEPWTAMGDDAQANVVVDSNPLSPSLTYPLLRPENYLGDWNFDGDELLSQGRIKEISNTHLIESAWQAYESNLHLEATVSEGRDGIKIEQQLEGRLEEGRMMHFRQIRYKCGAPYERHAASFKVGSSLTFDDINRDRWYQWRGSHPNETTTSVFANNGADDNTRQHALVMINGLWSGTQKGLYSIGGMKFRWHRGIWQGPVSEIRAYIQKQKAEEEQRERDYFRDQDNKDRWIMG